jgi:uncharacterized membrane protein YdbT with pleckstrin-like domain
VRGRPAEGERVVLDLRPHPRALVGPVAVAVLVALGAGYLLTVVPDGPAAGPLRILVAALAVVLLARCALWPWLRWSATAYVLTDRRLILRTGVLRRRGRDLPLARVTDVSYLYTSLLGRLLGCGTLVAESGGEHGPLVFADIPRVEEAQRQLYALIEARDRQDARARDGAAGRMPGEEYEVGGT